MTTWVHNTKHDDEVSTPHGIRLTGMDEIAEFDDHGNARLENDDDAARLCNEVAYVEELDEAPDYADEVTGDEGGTGMDEDEARGTDATVDADVADAEVDVDDDAAPTTDDTGTDTATDDVDDTAETSEATGYGEGEFGRPSDADDSLEDTKTTDIEGETTEADADTDGDEDAESDDE